MNSQARGLIPRRSASVVTFVSLALLPLGWHLGYHSAGAYLAFWTLNAAALWSALLIVQRVFPWRGPTDALIRTAIVAFAVAVLCGLLLGSVGLIGPLPFTVAV